MESLFQIMTGNFFEHIFLDKLFLSDLFTNAPIIPCRLKTVVCRFYFIAEAESKAGITLGWV